MQRLAANINAYSGWMERPPVSASAAMVPNTAVRPRLANTRTRSTRRRSIHAPAGSPRSRKPRNSQVTRNPTCAGVAFRVFTANSGMTTVATSYPNWLVVSADHSRRKFFFRAISYP